MKRILIVIIIILIFGLIPTKASDIIIPKEAIRLRVIPNSNSKKDQEIKLKVKAELEKITYNLLKNETSYISAKSIINENMDEIESSIKKVLLDEQYFLNYEINFGKNYFPEKEFKGVVYEEGNYESLVVTLGSGEGDNWWCVLFPPLCLLEATETEKEAVEYQFFVKEIIDKYF